MYSKRRYSVRRQPGNPAPHAAAAASRMFEALESRQLMSVAAPTVEVTGAMLATGPADTALYAPATPAPDGGAAVAPTVDASGATIIAPGSGDDQPPPAGDGDGTAEAKSFWDRVKGAAKWVKNHVTATLHSIGIKGTF